MKWPDDSLGKMISGDWVQSMKLMPEASVDSILTDPPYNISFMKLGKSDR